MKWLNMASLFLVVNAPHRTVNRIPATNPSFMRRGMPSRKKKDKVMERDRRILVMLETICSVQLNRYHRLYPVCDSMAIRLRSIVTSGSSMDE